VCASIISVVSLVCVADLVHAFSVHLNQVFLGYLLCFQLHVESGAESRQLFLGKVDVLSGLKRLSRI